MAAVASLYMSNCQYAICTPCTHGCANACRVWSTFTGSYVMCMGGENALALDARLTMYSCLPVHGLDPERATVAAEMCTKPPLVICV
jgi:hypothetical protein